MNDTEQKRVQEFCSAIPQEQDSQNLLVNIDQSTRRLASSTGARRFHSQAGIVLGPVRIPRRTFPV